jgi:hypothetical protein
MLQPLVKRFLGKIVDATEIGKGAQGHIIPALAPHLPLPILDAGGLGVCGKDVQRNGLCRLFPPLSCYLCPSFIAFRYGPHEQMLHSIMMFLQHMKDSADDRSIKQLEEVCRAIHEVLMQLGVDQTKNLTLPETGQAGDKV